MICDQEWVPKASPADPFLAHFFDTVSKRFSKGVFEDSLASFGPCAHLGMHTSPCTPHHFYTPRHDAPRHAHTLLCTPRHVFASPCTLLRSAHTSPCTHLAIHTPRHVHTSPCNHLHTSPCIPRHAHLPLRHVHFAMNSTSHAHTSPCTHSYTSPCTHLAIGKLVFW